MHAPSTHINTSMLQKLTRGPGPDNSAHSVNLVTSVNPVSQSHSGNPVLVSVCPYIRLPPIRSSFMAVRPCVRLSVPYALMSECPVVCLFRSPHVKWFACPYVCLSVRLSVCPYICASICPSVRVYAHTSVCPSSRLSICTSVRMPVCPDLRMSACTSVRMSVCVEVCRQSGLAKMASPQHRHGCWSYSRLKRTADQAWGRETQSERKISSRSAPKCDRGRGGSRNQPNLARRRPHRGEIVTEVGPICG